MLGVKRSVSGSIRGLQASRATWKVAVKISLFHPGGEIQTEDISIDPLLPWTGY